MLRFKRSLHKRKTVLIVLFGVLCAAVLAPSVIRLSPSTTAASTASTQHGANQGAAPELLASPRASAALQRLKSETGGRVVSHLSNKTGSFDFVRATGDALLSAGKASGTPEARAQAFLSEHGALVGLSDAELRRVAAGDSAASGPSSELRVVRVDRDNIGSTHVRFNQFYQGLPVFGAQLIVHMSERGITGINGDFVPDIKLAAAPRISPKEAGQIALRYQLAGPPLSVVKAELSIYRLGLLEGYRGPSVLAYGVEVTDRKASRDQIWINANSGKLINRIPLNHKALDRRIYSPDYDPDNPDMFVVKEEGDPPFPGPPPGTTGANPIDNLYLFAGQTYNLFASGFGRDSYDGLGHRMASVYLITDACPNAFWNGVATNYCPDFDADDVVAHEWGHAYTQFTHGLIYAYQSGALNESYSDIFGETVDLLNGVDAEGGSNNAQPLPNGQRWQVGDDVPTVNAEAAGILRDMWDPTRYQDPDKVSSPNYACGSGDGGGVHTNSGVPNHAFAIIVDGKTFNGQTVQGIGFTKALHIYYRAMTVYQTPTTDFPAHDQALQASCADLAQAGTNLNALSTNSANSTPSGQIITANDCLQVAKAMLAVEMSTPSPCPIVILLDPDAPEICLGATDIFTENWETGMDGWTLTSTGVTPDWDNRNWVVDSSLPAGKPGSAAYARNPALGEPGGGTCQPGGDFSGQFTIDSPTIPIPPGASTLQLSFDHYVATEATFDGGQVEISVNGGAFSLVAQERYLHNPPNSQFDAPPPVGLNTNPNAGEYAWNGTNIGTPSGSPPGSWGTTLVDLSSLAAPGNTIKIRFTFSQDGCNGVDGWYVDNVRLFSCPTLESPTLSIGADYENPDTNGSYTFNWIRPAGATGPDVLQESATSCAPLISDNAESGLGQWTVFSSAVIAPTWDNAPANAKPQHNSATFWAHGAEQQTQNTFTTLTYNNLIPIPNTGTTTLNFSDWYFNEDDDNGFVEVSTDNGATWTQVYSAFRNMGDLPDAGATAFANETLTDRNVDLSIYSGQSIRLRFKYLCGQSNFFLFIQYGWHIDNISITNESWQNVTTINATTFTVTGRGPGTRCYRVRTTYTLASQAVPSPYSNVVSATVLTGACLYTLDPTSEAFSASGGSDSVGVIAAAGCNWTANSNDGFITINSGSNGTGNGTVNYTVTSNTDDSSRSGSLTIAGQTFIVTQAGTGTPTAVTLESFTATGFDDGRVLLEWRTGFEVDNLGFNIYREAAGRQIRINQSMIAGSALVIGASTRLTAGRSYSWLDKGIVDCGSRIADCQSAQYLLEAVDLKGQGAWHGPVTIQKSEGISQKAYSAEQPATLAELAGADSHENQTTPVQAVARFSKSEANQSQSQSDLALTSAIKLSVTREGWYRATQADLVASGLDAKVDPRTLQLFVDGRELPILVRGEQDRSFDATDSVEFYGIGLDSPFSDSRVYWLVSGNQPGLRIKQSKTEAALTDSLSFPYTVERRDRSIYFSALRNGERENFFGAVLAHNPLDQTITLSHVARSDSSDALLEVAVQGVTLTAHTVNVELNGTQAGAIDFDGQSQGVATFNLAHSLLREGVNTVRLTPLGGQTDVSLVDYIRISYQHTYTADNDSLKLTAHGRQRVSIDGFTSDRVRVIDVTDPDAPGEIVGSVEKRKDGYAISFAASEAGERSLLVFTSEQQPVPSLSLNRPSNLRKGAGELVIVTRRELADSLDPLVALRRSQGLKVTVVDIEDIYDEFSFGQKSPYALKDFLAFSKSNWTTTPRFVLLAGDGSYDPKNLLGFGDSDLVPTKLVDTDYMETASDDWLADFDEDGVADLAIGRLPVRTDEQARLLVSKIIAYESSSPAREVLLAADANDGFDFEASNNELASLVPVFLRVTHVNRGRVDIETAKKNLFDGIQRGQKLVNYTGHGSANQWRGNLLTNADAGDLTNKYLPLFVMMTCLNGYFHDASLDSLAESLLKAEHGGAVAVWASSGMTLPEGQALMNQELYRQLFNQPRAITLGEAMMRTKTSITDSDTRRTWILLGDPTTKLR